MRKIEVHIQKSKVKSKRNESNDDKSALPYSHLAEKRKRAGIGYWLFTSLSVLFVAVVSYFAITYVEDDVTPKQNIKQIAGSAITQTTKVINPSKEEKRYYSTLIMGIDTRGVDFNGEEYIRLKRGGTRKIDVIMQVLYDRQEGRMIFISIPRDTSLPVEEECMHQEREEQKYINRIYDMAERNDCPFSGSDAMMKYVSYITGYPIDDYAIITLDTFVDLINIVGEVHDGKKGIWINVPRNIYDLCPNEWYGYDRVYYEQGRQFLTPKRALCYVRVRKASSDFDRNRRQQQVVNEVMRLITENETLSDPLQLLKVYNSKKDEIQMSKISLADVSMGLEMMTEMDLSNIQKIVLDYEFGGTNSLLTKPRFSTPGTHTRPGGYYLIPTAWDKDCCRQDEWKLVREYLHKLVEDPNAVNDAASTFAYINKYTGDKQAIFANNQYQEFKKKANENFIYFNESKYALPMLTAGPDIQVFDFSDGSKRLVAQEIADLAGGEVYSGSQAPFEPLNNEEIAIVVRIP